MLNPIIINTTTTAPTAGSIVVAYNWRSTDKRTVPESQKHRSILLPEGLIVDPSVAAVPAAFRPMVVDALIEIASARLADFCMSASMAATTVSADLFATPSLMAWNAERIALQQRLTADEIKAWLPLSATVLSAAKVHGEAGAKAVSDQLVKLAGPNHGLTPERATKFLSALWQSADADNLVGLRVLLRLNSIAESKSAESILDSILG